MRSAWLLLALSLAALPARAEDGGVQMAPAYSAASVVNSAHGLGGGLAPNTIATVYGQNLAFASRAVTAGDVRDGTLPTVLSGTGVRVLVNNVPAGLYFVSPAQVNFLVPGNLVPGRTKIQLVRDGWAGPAVYVPLRPAAPALFQLDPVTAVACRADGSVVTGERPARPGEVIVLYATGLGETLPPLGPGEIAGAAAWIARRDGLAIRLGGTEVTPGDILYAGVTPGFAGLYQINLRLPEWTERSPEIRVFLDGEASPEGIRIPAEGARAGESSSHRNPSS